MTHRSLVGVVLALAVATVVGLVGLWPSAAELPAVPVGEAPEVVEGEIVAFDRYDGEPDEFTGASGASAVIDVVVAEGDRAGDVVTIDTLLDGYPPLEVGDRVEVTRSTFPDGGEAWFITDLVRGPSLLLLLAVFVGAVLLVGRWQGLRSLFGLALSLGVVLEFIVPAILTGRSPFLVALVGSAAVLLVSMYLSHGPSVMTTAAVVGTMVALTITIGLGALFVDLTSLTGFASEDAVIARFAVEGLDLRGLVLAGLVIAALGVLDDVTVTQASTVFALRRAAPEAGWARLVREAMVVGRDHIASTVNTLVLAYAGASLALLLVFQTSGVPAGELVTSELLAEEIVKTLVGSLGIIAAVPLTTLLAAFVAVGSSPDALPTDGHTHGVG